jgi:ketosteroid isomerase-like protein
MKALLIGLLVCAAHTNLSAQDTTRIRELDAAWARAYQVHDTAFAIQLMADDFFMTSTNGSTKNKQRELGDIRPSPNWKVDYFRTADVRIRPFEGGAVVTGRLEWSTTGNDGRSTPVARRYTAVYARGGPLGYQIVALHVGQAPQ